MAGIHPRTAPFFDDVPIVGALGVWDVIPAPERPRPDGAISHSHSET